MPLWSGPGKKTKNKSKHESNQTPRSICQFTGAIGNLKFHGVEVNEIHTVGNPINHPISSKEKLMLGRRKKIQAFDMWTLLGSQFKENLNIQLGKGENRWNIR